MVNWIHLDPSSEEYALEYAAAERRVSAALATRRRQREGHWPRIAVGLLVFAMVLLLALIVSMPAEAHNPKSKNPHVRLHHAATAMLWLHKRPNAGTPNQWRASYAGHHWLFNDSMSKLGLLSPFLCIYTYEKGEDRWQTNTGNGFYGGLQMEMAFQRSHGPRYLSFFGTANRWPAWAQLHAAYDAWKTRGFGPWPNTRKPCGV